MNKGLAAYSNSNRDGKTLAQVRCPWKDYDSSCEDGVFFPMSPVCGGSDWFNKPRLAIQIRELNLLLTKPELTPRRIDEIKLSIRRMESYLAQLSGDLGSVPELAGKEYLAWVESLRTNAPVV